MPRVLVLTPTSQLSTRGLCQPDYVRHILDRLNAINEYLKKKGISVRILAGTCYSLGHTGTYSESNLFHRRSTPTET